MKNKDILTTVVRVKGSNTHRVVPVRSTGPIDKSLWLECSKCIGRIYMGGEISKGDIVCKNILNTGIDIICTRGIGNYTE